MITQRRMIVFGFLSTILFYLIITIIDFALNKEIGFIDSLTLTIPQEKIISRIIILTSLFAGSLAYNAWIQYRLKTNKTDLPGGKSDTPIYPMNPALLSAILNQLRVSLHTIVGFANLQKSKDLHPKTRDLYTKYIYDNSVPNLLLLDNVSDLFEIESGQISVLKDKCSLNTLFEELLLECENRNSQNPMKESRTVLVRSGNTEELVIRTDCRRLKQILSNLVINACIFSNLPKIEIGYTIEDSSLKFFIIDNVKKLRINDLDSVFSTKYNIKNIHTQTLIIAALRLKVAQKLVEALGGELAASSGTKVPAATYFTIPLEIVDQTQEVEIKKEKTDVPSWEQYHILIVEDIKINFIYLSELLKPTNIRITWVKKNGKEAVELFDKPHDYNVILMDILMPEMDGYEAAKIIKETDSDLPIIAQTAYSLESESEVTITNFDEILTKPIWSNDLIRILSKFLKSPEVTISNPD